MKGDYCKGARGLEVAEEELNEMTKAKEEGMGERAKIVKNVGRMKVMEGQMKGSSTFFHLPNSNGNVMCVFLDVSIWQKELANSIELKKLESRRIQSRMSSF